MIVDMVNSLLSREMSGDQNRNNKWAPSNNISANWSSIQLKNVGVNY